MVDTARHFEPVASLKAIVDSLAYAKLNVLHWLVTLYNHTSSCHHTAPHRTIPYHTHYITCSAMLNAELVHMIMVLCYAMLCYAMLCYAMLCYAMLCYAMLCYAMLWCGVQAHVRQSEFPFRVEEPPKALGRCLLARGALQPARCTRARKQPHDNYDTNTWPPIDSAMHLISR
jgi:hypothetical protein